MRRRVVGKVVVGWCALGLTREVVGGIFGGWKRDRLNALSEVRSVLAGMFGRLFGYFFRVFHGITVCVVV